MNSIMKTLLALALGFGFLVLDIHAKPTVAFLGLTRDSDPRISGDIARRIQWELGADTGLAAFSAEEVAVLYAKGLLSEPEAVPADMPKLAKGLGAQYYAFGKLENVAVTSKRIIWMPWSLKVKWTQGLRLRVLDGSNGGVVFDGLVTCEVPEKATFSAPDANLGKLSPLEREARLRIMAAAVSVESAKALSKALIEKAAGPAGEKAADAAGSEAKPAGG
jgi:hypothetical protein